MNIDMFSIIKEEYLPSIVNQEITILTHDNYTDYINMQDANLIDTIVKSLNVTFRWEVTPILFFPYGDICFSSKLGTSLYKLVQTLSSFISYDSLHIFTNDPGFLTPIEKIYNYYGITTVVSMTIVLSITFIVIFLCEEKKLSFAVFEILRLLVNTAMKTPMKKSAKRIFFSMIFLYFLIIQATFQGRLAGFLTKNERRRPVETIEELEDPQYEKIWYDYFDFNVKSEDIMKKLFTGYNTNSCYDVIKNNTSVACIDNLLSQFSTLFKLNLSVSKNPILVTYNFLLYRKNFALASRIDRLLSRLLKAGLLQKWKEQALAKDLYLLNVRTMKSITEYRPIDINDLNWIFIFLITGYTCAIICFIGEIFMKRKTKKSYRPIKLRIAVGLVTIQSREIINRLHRRLNY